jgi:flagellar basal-body rod protein FlgB
MDAVNLFQLATTQAKWLSLRQTAVANNIANANLPSYTAMDVEPFEAVLSNTSVKLEATSVGHFGFQPDETGMSLTQSDPDIGTSGKRVSLEEELVRSSEIRHAFQMNTAVVSAFHRMILMTAKS